MCFLEYLTSKNGYRATSILVNSILLEIFFMRIFSHTILFPHPYLVHLLLFPLFEPKFSSDDDIIYRIVESNLPLSNSAMPIHSDPTSIVASFPSSDQTLPSHIYMILFYLIYHLMIDIRLLRDPNA